MPHDLVPVHRYRINLDAIQQDNPSHPGAIQHDAGADDQEINRATVVGRCGVGDDDRQPRW